MSHEDVTSTCDSGEPAVRDASDDLSDGQQAIGYATGWVNNADTKAGLLSAAIALVLGALGQQTASIHLAVASSDGRAWTALTLLIAMGVCLLVAIAGVAWVLIPRTTSSALPSRFGFPTLALPGWKHASASRVHAAEEAWEQARILSCIASAKFRGLRVASIAVFLALPLYGAWVASISIRT